MVLWPFFQYNKNPDDMRTYTDMIWARRSLFECVDVQIGVTLAPNQRIVQVTQPL